MAAKPALMATNLFRQLQTIFDEHFNDADRSKLLQYCTTVSSNVFTKFSWLGTEKELLSLYIKLVPMFFLALTIWKWKENAKKI